MATTMTVYAWLSCHHSRTPCNSHFAYEPVSAG